MENHYIRSMLGENEKIVLITRQHWFVLFSHVFFEIIVILVMLVGLGFAVSIYPIAGIAYILIIIPLLSIFYDYLNWKNHAYLVTNRRVIQLSGIFNKKVIDSTIEKVNDVKLSQSFWGQIFDFGDVEIMTASELGVNVFEKIGEPVKFKTAMLNAREKLGTDGTNSVNPDRSDEIPGMIAELDELSKKGIITEAEFQQKKKELLSKI